MLTTPLTWLLASVLILTPLPSACVGATALAPASQPPEPGEPTPEPGEPIDPPVLDEPTPDPDDPERIPTPDPAQPCCFTNPDYAGVCVVRPAGEETCGTILDYLNNASSVGKTYCNSTEIRGGWDWVPCEIR